MQEISVNIWALLGCLGIRLAVGMIWFSPRVFWKPWQKVTGINEKQMRKGMARGMASDIVGSLLMAFVLLHAIRYAMPGSNDLLQGLGVGFMNWLGFVAVVQMSMVTYEARPMKFFSIVSGYHLVTILLMSLVLTRWG